MTAPRLSGSDTRSESHPRPTVAVWRLLALDRATAAEQMAVDEELARLGEPTLRLFRWARPALSLGYRQRVPSWIDGDALAELGIELVQRPTGGGLAVHGTDLSFSVVAPHAQVPSLRGLLELTCEGLAAGLAGLGIPARAVCEVPAPARVEWCLTQESPYALMVKRQKLCGLAIRRYSSRWLVQGSLLVRPIPQVFRGAMPAEAFAAFADRAIAASQAAARKVFDEELSAAIARGWRTAVGVPCEWTEGSWPRDQAVEWLEEGGQVVVTKWWRTAFAPTRSPAVTRDSASQ